MAEEGNRGEPILIPDFKSAGGQSKSSSNTNGIPPIPSAAEFMAGFEPPDYIIDGIIQRCRLYALTSPTGHGKTAVALYMAAWWQQDAIWALSK